MIDLQKGSTRTVRSGCSRRLSGNAVSMLVLLAASSARAEGNGSAPAPPAATIAPAQEANAPAPAVSTTDPCPCANALRAKQAERPLIERGYGLQTLAFDGAALALFATYAASNAGGGDVLPVLSGASYIGGGPIVHLAHGHVDKAFISLGLRGGLPLAFGIAGGFIAANRETNHGPADMYAGIGGLVIGMGVGMVAASALDATLVANERVPAPLPREAGKITNVSPSVSVLPQGGAMLALRGSIF